MGLRLMRRRWKRDIRSLFEGELRQEKRKELAMDGRGRFGKSWHGLPDAHLRIIHGATHCLSFLTFISADLESI